MNEFTTKELEHIIFLCFSRKQSVGIEEAEQEGTGDLYRKIAAMIRDDGNE